MASNKSYVLLQLATITFPIDTYAQKGPQFLISQIIKLIDNQLTKTVPEDYKRVKHCVVLNMIFQ